MKILFKTIFVTLLFLFALAALPAEANFWRHPEIADKNSVFIDLGLPIRFDYFSNNFKNFNFILDIRVEYVPPLPLPFSFGIFIQTPNPNFKSFGLRLAYHFDLFDHLTDFYFVYSFDFGFLLNDVLIQYNDTPVPLHFYDFRFGIRRFFGSWFGVAIETGFKFESLILMVSIKAH